MVCDLRFGDTGKGSVTHLLAKKPMYNMVVRHCGGGNAGHQVTHNGEQFSLHLIPMGVFFDKTSVIGPCCFLNIKSFFKEADELESVGIQVYKNIKIAYNTHIVTEKHLEEEKTENRIGTTKRGIGPCARDKYSRVGKRAEQFKELAPYLVDTVELLNNGDNNIIFEGAQGLALSINARDYPFVTCSDIFGSVIESGVSPRTIDKIYGVIKIYDTYVGAKSFQPENDEALKQLQIVGREVGVTTGRKRQTNWLNIDELQYALKATGCTHLVVNKCDVIKTVNVYKAIYKQELVTLSSIEELMSLIRVASREIIQDIKFHFRWSATDELRDE